MDASQVQCYQGNTLQQEKQRPGFGAKANIRVDAAKGQIVFAG
jgi:hypothetical protein